MQPLLRRRATRYICTACSHHFRPISRAALATQAHPRHIFDVVCVGGGPAGLTLLAALKANPVTSGLRVALIEAHPLSAHPLSVTLPDTEDVFSNRCSSLTPTSAAYLAEIGVWNCFRKNRIQPYHEMQVWDGVSGARIEFDWDGRPGQTIAYMIENVNIVLGLLEKIRKAGIRNCRLYGSTSVQGITFGEDADGMNLSEWPVIHLSTGHRIWARLLVGADGANSPVRSFAGIESRGWDYGRHGLVATLKLEGEGWGRDGTKIAYQRFLPTGPVAVLPLPGNYSSLVWSTTPKRAERLKSLSPKDFTAMVNAAFRLSPVDLEYLHSQTSGQEEEVAWRMQHVSVQPETIPQRVTGVQEGSVASFPLKMRHADTYIGERVALVGDAAHTIHPLAGQGLNQGQADVQSLVKTIAYAVSHGQDIGTQLSLESYNTERYAANHAVMGVCDKLHKLYSFDSGPVVGLRSLGLGAVNTMRPVKDFFMNQAAGNGFKLFN